MQYTEANIGRIFILRLHDNDRLPNILEDFADKQNLSSGLCFFLGGAKENSRIVVGPKEGNVLPPEPMVTLLKGVHEACGIGTIIKNEEGKPKLHMHASFGREQEAITGCVRLGVEVWQIGEVIIIELVGGKTKREVDKKTGFEFLQIQK